MTPIPATEVSIPLANYWVDLTTKGQTQFSVGEFTEKELIEAFEAGKKLLPPGDEPLMAYFINASPLFLKHLRAFPPLVTERASESSNDLALFLRSHDFLLVSAVLQVVGCLEASIEREGQRCRKISENQLEIAWKTEPPLYLHSPLFFEQSLEFIGEALEKNAPETALCLSQALDLVVPSFFDLPPQGRTMGRNDTLNEIYRLLCRRKNFYAVFKLLFLFKGAGWNPLETSTVLDLPEQLKFIARSGQFARLLPALRAVYASTPFALLLEDMVARVQKNENPSESFLICRDVGILSSVWKSDVPKRVDFLVESASTMPEEALPFALAHVCKSDQIAVVGAYLERLLQQEPPFVFAATYEPNLRRSLTTLLKSDPSLEQQLNSYPRVMQIVRPEEFLRSQLNKPEQMTAHLVRNLSYLTDHTIIRDLTEVLVRGAHWANCRLLLERLVTDDAFLEDAVVLFETVATTSSSCMEVAIPRMGKRLNSNQKQRLAQAYATALKGNPRILGALPSEDWLLGQLRREESWEGFATVFCHLSTSQDFRDKKVMARAVQEAEWIAPQLLTLKESPLFAPFEALVCRFPKRDLDASVWKPHLAGLLARNTTNGALFDKLHELATGKEKEAITRCRKLKKVEISEQLSAYRATGVFPDHHRAENAELQVAIREALAKQDFVQVVSLLKKTTAPEWELWDEFIRALPDEAPNSLVESAWAVWVQKHPVATFKPAEGKYWEDAFLALLGNIANNSDVFVNFLTKQAIAYAHRLEGHPSEVLVGLCLEKGILSSWSNKSDQRGVVVGALASIISNKKLEKRHGPLVALLKEHYQVFLHLLFVQQNDERLYTVGNSWFLDNIGKTPLSDPLLKGYSMCPYVPRLLVDQIALLNWIEKSWPVNYEKLTWVETQRLCSSLCELKVEQLTHEQRLRYLILLGQQWDQLLVCLPQLVSVNPVKLSEAFLALTKAFLIRTMKYIENKEIKYRILAQARYLMLTTFSMHLPLKANIQFQLECCTHLFSLLPLGFPDNDALLKNSLDDLNLCILQLEVHDEKLLKEGISIFREALPRLLEVSDTDILPHIQILMDNLLTFPSVTEAKPEEKFSWFSVLTNMCAGFQKVSRERRAAVAIFASQVFMNCTHPEKVKVLTGKVDKKLISSSCTLLASVFLAMPEPENLESSMWNTLIQGFSNHSMERMALQLFQEVKRLPPNAGFMSHMAIALLICHTKPSDAKFMDRLEEFCVEGTGEGFHQLGARCEPLLQLRLHSHWVLTLASLTKKCSEFERKPLLALTTRKIALATKLTTIACTLIKYDATYKLYSPYLFRALGNDLEVMQAVYDNLIPGEVEGLKQFKSLLAGKIQSLGNAN